MSLSLRTLDVPQPFGAMHIVSAIAITISDNDPTEVKDGSGDGFTAGELNLITFPTGGTEHYLTIPIKGKYFVTWAMSVKMTTVPANRELHGGVMVDDTAIRDAGEAHRTVSGANDTGSMCGSTIVDCPNGTEEISLWVANATSTDNVTVDHGSVSVKWWGYT